MVIGEADIRWFCNELCVMCIKHRVTPGVVFSLRAKDPNGIFVRDELIVKARLQTNLSTPSLAAILGYKDHSAIVNSLRRSRQREK